MRETGQLTGSFGGNGEEKTNRSDVTTRTEFTGTLCRYRKSADSGQAFKDSRELAQKLVLLELELKIRLNIHEAPIVDVLQRIMKILDPPPPPPEPPPPEIGLHVKEDAVHYRVKRKIART